MPEFFFEITTIETTAYTFKTKVEAPDLETAEQLALKLGDYVWFYAVPVIDEAVTDRATNAHLVAQPPDDEIEFVVPDQPVPEDEGDLQFTAVDNE